VRADDPLAGYWVQLEIALPAAGALSLAVKAGHIYFFRSLRQDLIVGDAAFDDRYIVRCRPREMAALWLDADTRDVISGAYDPSTSYPSALTIADQTVTFTGDVGADDEVGFMALVAAAITAAELPERIATRWAAAIEPTGGQRVGPWHVDGGAVAAWAVGRCPLRIDAGYQASWEGGTRPWLRARVRALREPGQSFVFARRSLSRRQRPVLDARLQRVAVPAAAAWDVRAEDPAALAPHLDTLARQLARTGALAIVGRGPDLVAVVPHAAVTAAVLAEVGTLLATLAEVGTAAAGPYR
jgi:hypothetical protein